MDYIFNDWEKKLSAFEDSVEKKLEDIRQCKEDIQKLKAEVINHMQKGKYIRDDQRLILSAPEVIIGNLDPNGLLYSKAGSVVVVRGTHVSLEGVGEGGQVETRAASIRQTAEDPGIDGLEHVLTSMSQVVSQARNIVIQSDNAEETFSAVTCLLAAAAYASMPTIPSRSEPSPRPRAGRSIWKTSSLPIMIRRVNSSLRRVTIRAVSIVW